MAVFHSRALMAHLMGQIRNFGNDFSDLERVLLPEKA
jgi:hypothetical protein